MKDLPSDQVITNKHHYDSVLKRMEELEEILNNRKISWNLTTYSGIFQFNSEIGKEIPKDVVDNIEALFNDINQKCKDLRYQKSLFEVEKSKYSFEYDKFLKDKFKLLKKVNKIPKWIKWLYNIKIEKDDKK